MGGKRLFSLVYLPFLLLPGGALALVWLLIRFGLPADGQAALDRLLAVGGPLAVILSLGAGWWVSHRLRRGLDDLRSGMARHGAGELGWRIPHQPVAALQAVAHAEITLVEQVEARLADAMQRLTEQEAVLSSMSEGVLAVDHGLRVLNLNPAAGRMFGVNPGGARGRTLLEVSRHNELLHFATAALEASAPTEGEIVIHDPDPRYLQAHGSVLRDAQGRSIGAVVVLNDVTALRKLETIRRDFVANVSHELKTPITSIKGFVETLLEGAIRDPKESDRFLRIVQRQAERLQAIIEDLLNLSRIERDAEAGDIPLELGAIKPVLTAAVQSCETQAGARGVRLQCDCDAALTAWINAPLLEQALVNLIDNAVKYSPAGSTVRLEAAAQDGNIAIRVRDEGVGIEARHLPRLFERFYRVDKARSRKLGGTGLGLAIVKHIAQAHKGQIGVESVPGQGSTFTLLLPVQTKR